MKQNFIDLKEKIINYIDKNRKISAIILMISVVVVIGMIWMIPKAQANIRASEIQSLVTEEPLNKKAIFLNSKTADQEISEKTAITVLFSEPSGKTYDEILEILKDKQKMSEFNHSIYLYPIVYDAQKIEAMYNIKMTEPTIIFFENGKEKNRLTINSTEDMQSMFIPALNQLPLASVDQTTQSPTTASSTETNPTTETSQSTELSQSSSNDSALVEPQTSEASVEQQ